MRIFLNKCFLKTKQSIRFLPLIKFRISRWSYSTLRTQRSRTWHETNWGSFPHHHQINNTWDKGGCELALYLLVQGVYRLKARKWFASWKQRNGLWAHRECFLIQKNIQKNRPRTHQLKPLQYFKLTSWILFCQQNCITHGHAAKCFQRGQLSFNALCTPQTPTPLDFSPDVSPDVTDCHFLFFFLFFSWLKLHTSLKLSLPLWTTARASIAQTHIGIFLKHCDSLKTVATQQYLISP